MSQPVLALEGVSRTYPGPPEVAALRSCDLTVQRGEWLSITGPSGSGKSTLLNVLGLLDRPDAGSYRIDGEETTAMPDRVRTTFRAQRLGFVFQAFHLLPQRTIQQNVAVALMYNRTPRRQRRAAALLALDAVGLAGRADALPSELSGGQQQRVAIARALALQPDVLLCDEPTGNLDSRTAAEILHLIADLHAQGRTILLITHNPDAAALAPRTLTIMDGLLREPRSAGVGT